MSATTPHELVIIGATGDLATKKLYPALFLLERDGLLGEVARIVGLGRTPLNRKAFLAQIEAQLRPCCSAWLPSLWQHFARKLDYLAIDLDQPESVVTLAQLTPGSLFYLATLPRLYGTICQRLEQAGMITENSRVVLEKPLGHDLNSCRQINDAVAQVFDECQIYRIDHYLGKETVQNLLALRFGNALFEPLWNSHYIDNIQITVAESVGPEGREAYYAEAGALRDMVQNHMLQLLCMVAMEPPNQLNANDIRTEKSKILRSLAPVDQDNLSRRCVRGQYQAGVIDGQAVPGLLELPGYQERADLETFVALRTEVRNWRWAGVPFYLRTGKRMPQRYSEIVIEFKPPPFSIFPAQAGIGNRLVIRLQPEENITLYTMNKRPGLSSTMRLHPVALDLTAHHQRSPEPHHDAYERLLLDLLHADQTLFMSRDEVELAWRWIDQLVAAWEQAELPLRHYAAGSPGPASAQALPEREGRSWFER